MTSEHVWKLDANGEPEEWDVSDWDNGDDYGNICAICDESVSMRYDGSARQEPCEPEVRAADERSRMIQQLRLYSQLAKQRGIRESGLRDELARIKDKAEKDAKGVEGAIKWANLHRIQADEAVACIQHEAARLRTRVAELEAQLAQCQIEEHAHAEK